MRRVSRVESRKHRSGDSGTIAARASLRAENRIVRPLQRMGEEIAETELDRFAALEARMEAEFRELAPVKEEESAS